MKLSGPQLDMLYRYALAEHWTSPSERPSYDADKAVKWLLARELITPIPPRRLTDHGRELLDEQLRGERRDQLNRVRARRAARKENAR